MKILSIDGGGVFGIIPAYFLQQIDLSKIDCFTGTSVGSILVLAYASGQGTTDVFKIFNESVYKIFSEKTWGLKGPKFKDKNLNEFLQKYITKPYFSMKPTFVPAYNICTNSPKVFDNVVDSDDKNFLSWEIARASAAAPTYFSPYKDFIDGGVVANSPAMLAAWGLSHKQEIPFSEMEIFSIGTGWMPPDEWTSSDINKWWIWQWIKPITQLVTNGNEEMFDFGCRQLPFKKYIRFEEIELPKKADFTDPSIIPDILKLCEKKKKDFDEAYIKFMS